MKIQALPYRDRTDLANIRQLLVVGALANIPASYIHAGCVDVAIHYPLADADPSRNLRLWEIMDGMQPSLAALAIFLPHEDTSDLFIHPALHGTPVHEAVMDEYVAWAEARGHARLR